MGRAGVSAPGETSLEAPGLREDVRIDYDAHDVPFIRARNKHDGMFALGYAQASARLFQMDLMRRLARGEVSKLAGPKVELNHAGQPVAIDVLEVDYFLRVLDFVDTGRRYLATSSADTRESLAAYVDGINAFVALHQKNLSAPYSVPGSIGGLSFEPWTTEDSAAIMVMISWMLSKNAGEEYFASLALREGLSLERIVDLLSPYYPLRAEQFKYLESLRGNLEGMRFLPGFADLKRLSAGSFDTAPAGSNNWALSGARSKSGKPILANDPHLGLSVPGFWFLASLDTPNANVTGAIPPGLPAFVIGHNGRVAWGVTMAKADTVDTAIETVDPEAKNLQAWRAVGAPKRTHDHRRLGRKHVDAHALRHGLRAARHRARARRARRREPALERVVPVKNARRLLGTRLRENAQDVLDAGANVGAISLNLVTADAEGNIGWTITGDLPKRDGFRAYSPRTAPTNSRNGT
ncbi:MAG: penicillin acylase family protein, partial [Deltaproteobacteria bacterium]|nr:penicillin acylase family protein [Deltaproteobacteria bacterium]